MQLLLPVLVFVAVMLLMSGGCVFFNVGVRIAMIVVDGILCFEGSRMTKLGSEGVYLHEICSTNASRYLPGTNPHNKH